MADIDLVPKRRTATWVWLLVAAIVIVAILMLLTGGRGQGPTPPRQGVLLTPAGAPTASATLPRG